MIFATIKAWDVKKVEEKVEKLNRRAKKLGLEPLTIQVGHEVVKEEKVCVDDYMGIYRTVVNVYRDVEIHGELPVIPGGWKLVGIIEHDSLGIVKTIPGEEIPEFYYDREVCDHCGVNRFRNKTIIVKNTDGEYKQVGTTCVESYLGINPNTLLFFMEIGAKDFDEDGGAARVPVTYHLEDFTQVTIAIIKQYGWVSRSQVYNEGGYATADAVMDYYNYASKSGEKIRKEITITDEIVKEADACLEWVKNVEKTGDYFFNVKRIVEAGYVPQKGVGIAASIYPCYLKTTITKKEEKVSNWQGEVGKKIKVEVTFSGEFSFESTYGVTYVKRFADKDGNIFVWFTTSHNGFETDKTYTIQGTVKKHDAYNDKLQTVLSRVKKC